MLTEPSQAAAQHQEQSIFIYLIRLLKMTGELLVFRSVDTDSHCGCGGICHTAAHHLATACMCLQAASELISS